MKTTGKIIGGIAIVIVLIALILCVAACIDSGNKTYEYEGKNVFVVGEGFDFENSKILKKDKDGKVVKTSKISKKDLYDFSTEKAVGEGEFTVKISNTEVKVPYTVCAAPQKISERSYDAVTGSSARIYRDFIYGTRLDEELSSNNQTFDVYVPTAPENVPADAKVILFVHGGAWMSGDKNGDGNALCDRLVREGFVVFSMNYRLATMKVGGGTLGEMVRDIDTMVGHMKLFLAENGLTATKIGIGGISAGGHLSSLYAYKDGWRAPLEIAFEIDIVGPNQFGDVGYEKTIEPYLYVPEAGDSLAAIKKLLQPMAVELLYSMSGFEPGSIPELELIKEGKFTKDMDLTGLWEKVDAFSPVTYINANTCPTILAYGAVDKKKADNILLNLFPDDVVTDTMVPTTCYDTMERLLTENGIHHVGQIFYGSDHTSVACVPGKPSLDKIVEWVKDFSSRYL